MNRITNRKTIHARDLRPGDVIANQAGYPEGVKVTKVWWEDRFHVRVMHERTVTPIKFVGNQPVDIQA